MKSRYLLLVLLLATLCLPFLLRPKRGVPAGRAAETLVIITPHNEALRFEFGRGFVDWYRKKTGRTVAVDWRVIGGTSEISRFLEGEYVASFQLLWTRKLDRNWSAEIQQVIQYGRLPPQASPEAREAHAAFLNSEAGCGIDLFFGGGPYDFIRQADAGRLVDSGIRRLHPEWFTEDTIPAAFAGEPYRDEQDLWIGTVLSGYGLLYNEDALQRLGLTLPPSQWTDLADPRYFGELALADPTKSGSVAKVLENIIQQQMQRRWFELRRSRPHAEEKEIEAAAVRQGWIDGLRLLQLIGANARYFSDTSQKPPIDVAQGDSAVGLCIDFYGRQQAEAVQRRSGRARVNYLSPVGGSVSSVDPIALLRGAPHREVAVAFIEYVLSMEGQKLWDFRPGTPGGPERFALRRMPVRRDFYQQAGFKSFLSDPADEPYSSTERLIYRPQWTSGIFRELAFVFRVMCLDTHAELTGAWRAINDAGRPPEALATLQDLSAVDYDTVRGEIKRLLAARDKAEEIRLAGRLGDGFRAQYARAREQAEAARSGR